MKILVHKSINEKVSRRWIFRGVMFTQRGNVDGPENYDKISLLRPITNQNRSKFLKFTIFALRLFLIFNTVSLYNNKFLNMYNANQHVTLSIMLLSTTIKSWSDESHTSYPLYNIRCGMVAWTSRSKNITNRNRRRAKQTAIQNRTRAYNPVRPVRAGDKRNSKSQRAVARGWTTASSIEKLSR